MLDVDHGTYPFVTSFEHDGGGGVHRFRRGAHEIGAVIGVSKDYTRGWGAVRSDRRAVRRRRPDDCGTGARSTEPPRGARGGAAGSTPRPCGTPRGFKRALERGSSPSSTCLRGCRGSRSASATRSRASEGMRFPCRFPSSRRSARLRGGGGVEGGHFLREGIRRSSEGRARSTSGCSKRSTIRGCLLVSVGADRNETIIGKKPLPGLTLVVPST